MGRGRETNVIDGKGKGRKKGIKTNKQRFKAGGKGEKTNYYYWNSNKLKNGKKLNGQGKGERKGKRWTKKGRGRERRVEKN